MKLLNRVYLHPYLIGIFPVLSLYAHNQSQLQSDAVWRSLMVIIVGTTMVLIIMRIFLNNWGKATLITSYASLFFFLYNPIREIFYYIHSSNVNLGWNRYFFPVWLLALIIGIWIIVKKLPGKENPNQILNLVALVAILLPSASVVTYVLGHGPVGDIFLTSSYNPPAQNSARVENQPDIYYLILDMYGRSDTIEDEFGYDNSSFLTELRAQGFYVASCSTSNYSHTVLSMASSFNMNFLYALGDDFLPGNTDYSNADAIIENNAVWQYLHEYGYSFVSFESGYPYVDIPNADVYIQLPKQHNTYIQPFELLLIEQTPISIFIDEILSYDSKAATSRPTRIYGPNYERTLFALEQLSHLPRSVPGPKFVYAHLIIPHPPYVFGPNGEYVGNDERLNGGPDHAPVDEAAYHLGYTNQLRYIDSVIPDLLEQILSRSETPPIIIVQGDHGFWGGPDKRLPILNAYFLPGKDMNQILYPGITPVNSFRIVLNTYFAGQFELLPDEKYPTVNEKDFYDVRRMDEDAIGCKPK